MSPTSGVLHAPRPTAAGAPQPLPALLQPAPGVPEVPGEAALTQAPDTQAPALHPRASPPPHLFAGLEAHHDLPLLRAPGIRLLFQHALRVSWATLAGVGGGGEPWWGLRWASNGETEAQSTWHFLCQCCRFRYCRMLEEGSFRGRKADFVFMFLFGGVLMTVSFCTLSIIGPKRHFLICRDPDQERRAFRAWQPCSLGVPAGSSMSEQHNREIEGSQVDYRGSETWMPRTRRSRHGN